MVCQIMKEGVITMEVKYNVTGSERKALVGAISEILGQASVYNGAPTFAYSVGSYLIDKDGTLSCPTDNSHEEIKGLLAALKKRGCIPEAIKMEDLYPTDKMNIQIPKADFSEGAVENLKKIIASKEKLIEKALGTNSLPLDITDETLNFPWFTLNGIDGESDAYARFITALCQMAKVQKRITAKEKQSENDKFTMRLFLIRLGFVGPEYKTARAILLRNLTGNSSFKNGQRPNKAAANENTETVTPSEAASAENLANVTPENTEEAHHDEK